MDRCHKYRSVFCGAHVHSYRGLPHGPEYPALCHGARSEAAAWILHRQSVRTAQETDRRQRRLTEDLLAHKLPDLAGTIVTPVAAVLMLFLFDWKMGLLCLLTMVLALLSMCLMMGGKNAGFFHRYQKEIERMSGEAVEYVRGIPV